jgi:hypothetical protein
MDIKIAVFTFIIVVISFHHLKDMFDVFRDSDNDVVEKA